MMIHIKNFISLLLLGTSFNRGLFGYFIFGNICAIFLVALLLQGSRWFFDKINFSEGVPAFRIIAISILMLYAFFSIIVLWNTLRKTSSFVKRVLIYSLFASFFTYAGISYMNFKGLYTTEITVNGSIQPSTFIKIKDLIDRSIVRPKRIIINSSGGSTETGIAIGMLIHPLNIDIEVVDLCASSCANYIFTSGNKKLLNKDSVVLFQGGMQQENLRHSIASYFNGESRADDEGKNSSSEYKEFLPANVSKEEEENLAIVKSFIGLSGNLSPNEYYEALERIESKFFLDRGIDREIMTYGQRGEYENIYKSKEYIGFYYSIESMKKMGIKDIHIIGEEWIPESNPKISEFYKVDF